MVGGEHSRKEPFKQLVNNYSKPLQRRVFFRVNFEDLRILGQVIGEMGPGLENLQ
jgi:hypothetical protein